MSDMIPFGPSRRQGQSPFDAIRHVDEDPERGEFEWWSAREAMPYLGYERWENVQNVIRKAMAACRNAGHDPTDHFRDVTKMVSIGSGASRTAADVQMTRFGMYLLAMNGDPDKPEIAAAQRYFVIQTRRAEQQLSTPQPQPAAPPAIQAHRPWADRFRRTFMPHVSDLHQRHPGCFSVVSAAVTEILIIEDEIVRHLMTTRGFDRPDISIGMRYATDRRVAGLPMGTRSAQLYLPDQQMHVEVKVYDGAEWPRFSMWFRNTYLSTHLGYYLDHKPELRPYQRLTRFSAADNACQSLSGRQALLPSGLRAALTAAGGFSPDRAELPG